MTRVVSIKLNNGFRCPILGLGTYRTSDDETSEAIKHSIDAGYRLIDTAFYYKNEEAVGRAINEKIREGVVTRSEIFIVTKLWNTFHRSDLVQPALEQSLKNLGLDYIDLYLIHWPVGFKDGWELMPKNSDGLVDFSDSDYVHTWKAMEECVRKGLIRSIGVSNFNKKQIQRILSVAEIKPVTNQVECHLYFNQNKLLDYVNSEGIVLTAYMPLGGPSEIFNSPLHDPVVHSIAEKYKKTPAQVTLRFHIQRGVIVIPKSIHQERIKSNLEVFDFELSNEDMNALEKLDKGEKGRVFGKPELGNHKHYPFHEEF